MLCFLAGTNFLESRFRRQVTWTAQVPVISQHLGCSRESCSHASPNFADRQVKGTIKGSVGAKARVNKVKEVVKTKKPAQTKAKKVPVVQEFICIGGLAAEPDLQTPPYISTLSGRTAPTSGIRRRSQWSCLARARGFSPRRLSA